MTKRKNNLWYYCVYDTWCDSLLYYCVLLWYDTAWYSLYHCVTWLSVSMTKFFDTQYSMIHGVMIQSTSLWHMTMIVYDLCLWNFISFSLSNFLFLCGGEELIFTSLHHALTNIAVSLQLTVFQALHRWPWHVIHEQLCPENLNLRFQHHYSCVEK